ncbi:hypothetical protein ABIB68_003350 [Bradyrhizobium sp. F1.2.2]
MTLNVRPAPQPHVFISGVCRNTSIARRTTILTCNHMVAYYRRHG